MILSTCWHNASTDTIEPKPVLALRGGGASLERKRKRQMMRGEATVSSTTIVDSNADGIRDTSDSTKTPAGDSVNHDAAIVATLQDGEILHTPELPEQVNTKPTVRRRFICFIGNLPYTATDESIIQHFLKLKPVSVRHRTNPKTGSSKGFAFVEFAAFDHLKTCLEQFHLSKFDDGQSPPRKINVELTAGGGGSKSFDRRAKLKAKNLKLNQQRLGKTDTETRKNNTSTTGSNVHPSRLERMAKVQC
ncbi:hypothetical protein MMC25_008278 [Agyrium rufum]|nr:hypothetical protein [Agyrium rufum]